MINNARERSLRSSRIGSPALTFAIVAALAAATRPAAAQSDLPPGGVFEPRVEAAVQYVSNINLAEESADEVDSFGLELSPGFRASYSTGAVRAAIDYSLIARTWEDSDFNDISHRLAANGQWIAVPEWFRVQGQASYTDAVIDPAESVNFGGLGIFGQGNLAEVAAASVNPILQHRFNDLEFIASYSYGRTWYLDEGKGVEPTSSLTDSDSRDQDALVSFGTAASDAKLSGRIFYNWQKSEFENSLPYKFERAGVDASAQVSATVALVGDVGRESDLEESASQGGLDSTFWSTGLRWTPNERTEAEARVGERFFGTSYSLMASHRARMLEFSASYSEQPTVTTRRVSLSDIIPGELPPDVPDFDLGIQTAEPFVAKNTRVAVTANGSRTRLSLTAFQTERDYQSGNRQDETGTGVYLDARRQLASNLSTNFNLSYSEFERTFDAIPPAVSTVTTSYDTQATLNLERKSGQHLTLTAETGYLNRGGNRDYDGWWVGMRARWTP